MKKILLAALLLTATGEAPADDVGRRYLALEPRTCGQYTQAYKDPQAGANVELRGWVAGYLTAYNTLAADTYSITGGSDLDAAMLWLANWCMAHPSRQLSNAMEALTAAFHPQRQRTKEAGR
ncbi:MAG: hypothetical protein HY017_00330 [Betaproteobacteria bacterium]|nr:hypothetical protein [Betaproteobacteria bacterium]